MKVILVDAAGTFTVNGKIFEEMHALLETYPNRKIILTNANDEQMPRYGLVDLPYELFTLKHDPDKVDPKYFEAMLKHFNLQASDVIYFEHSKEAVESAMSVGITSFHYDSEKKNLDTLKSFIDENI